MPFSDPKIYAGRQTSPSPVNFKCEHYPNDQNEPVFFKMLPSFRTNQYGFGRRGLRITNIPCYECPECTSQDITREVRDVLDDIQRKYPHSHNIDFSTLCVTKVGD